MKRNDWILTVSVFSYSYLFYKQTAGINFLLFNMILLIALVLKDKSILKNYKWKIAATGSLLSAVCVAYYANSLSIIANVISLSLVSALSFNSKSSVVLSLVYSSFSYLSSAVYMFWDWTQRKANSISESGKKTTKRFVLFILPILVTAIFFQMYRSSNPLFDEFANKINFNFISFSWITFTLGGLLLTYGFLYHRRIENLAEIDDNIPSNLSPVYESNAKLFGKEIGINDETFSGVVLFLMLNVLLLVVNLLDINFMFIDHKLPKGIGYSEFVHQGTGMIITSIVVAIIIILYCFRGAINFYEKNKTIKLLAYAWILQNVFMLASTAMRNDLYITECGLTYKRIGVYFYLSLSAIGLITTLIKIMKIKSNNYLFRINGWIFYSVLIASCFFSWDTIITKYNITGPKQIEKKYLTRLSNSNLPMLYQFKHLTDAKLDDSTKHYSYSGSEYDNYTLKSYNETLSKKLYDFMQNQDSIEWKSWCYENARVYNEMQQLNKEHKIIRIELQNSHLTTLIPIKEFENISELNISNNQINPLELQYFTELKQLNISFNKLTSIDSLLPLKKLEFLDISGNSIKDYRALSKLSSLKVLYVSSYIAQKDYDELVENLPNVEIVKETNSVANQI